MNKKRSVLATIFLILGVLICISSYYTIFVFQLLALIMSIAGTSLIIASLIVVVHKTNKLIEEADTLKQAAVLDMDQITDISNENKHLTSRVSELVQQNQALTDSLELANSQIEDLENNEAEIEPVNPYSGILPSSSETKVLNIIYEAKKVITEMERYAKDAGIVINLSHSSEQIHVKADPKLINIMFRNIVDNSIKYMNQTGSLVITISSIGDDLFIVLKDNGKGLDSVEADHIFELNYQGSNRVSGNGLGLTQSKAIVENFGGTIYAKTGKGQGMAIYIQLPASKCED